MAQLTRSTVTGIQAEVAAAVKEVLDKHGMKLTRDRGSFDPSMLRLTLECSVLSDDGDNLREKANWDTCCAVFDLKPEDRNRVVNVPGIGPVKLVSIEPGRPKYPFVGIELDTGRRKKYTESHAKWMLSLG